MAIDHNSKVLNPLRASNLIMLASTSHELLRQLASAAFAVGNFELKAKFDNASAKIKRDIVFAASLYL